MIYDIEMLCIIIDNPIYEDKEKWKYILHMKSIFRKTLKSDVRTFQLLNFILNYSFSFPTNPALLWAPAFSQGIHGGHSRSRINLGHGRLMKLWNKFANEYFGNNNFGQYFIILIPLWQENMFYSIKILWTYPLNAQS